MQRTHTPWLAYACLAASMALVGSYVGLSRLLVAVFPVFLLAWLRFGIAALAMLHWVRRGPGDAPLSRHDRWLLFWESFLGNFLFSICMLYGVKLSSAVAAGVAMAGIPAAVALLSWLVMRERIAPRVWLAIACAGSGIAMLALARNDGAAPVSAAGFALLMGAVFCEACYVVIGKRLTGNVSPRRISALIAGPELRLHRAAMWGLLVFYALAASVVTVWLPDAGAGRAGRRLQRLLPVR
jgi:drug/metabolite transporter (DMT)-like permease